MFARALMGMIYFGVFWMCFWQETTGDTMLTLMYHLSGATLCNDLSSRLKRKKRKKLCIFKKKERREERMRVTWLFPDERGCIGTLRRSGDGLTRQVAHCLPREQKTPINWANGGNSHASASVTPTLQSLSLSICLCIAQSLSSCYKAVSPTRPVSTLRELSSSILTDLCVCLLQQYALISHDIKTGN